jgi:hypothetical protein
MLTGLEVLGDPDQRVVVVLDDELLVDDDEVLVDDDDVDDEVLVLDEVEGDGGAVVEVVGARVADVVDAGAVVRGAHRRARG